MNKFIVIFIFILVPISVVYAMADGRVPVYGVPTLYGEYEITGDDINRANKIYGTPPSVARPAPIRTHQNIAQPQAKHPVKSKGAAKKKKSVVHKKAAKSASLRAAENKSAPDIIIVPPRVVMAPTLIPAERAARIRDNVADTTRAPSPSSVSVSTNPSPYAENIAGALSYKYDIESYCVQRRPLHTGKLPDGIVLMPGRPDLMSCTIR